MFWEGAMLPLFMFTLDLARNAHTSPTHKSIPYHRRENTCSLSLARKHWTIISGVRYLEHPNILTNILTKRRCG